MDKISEIEDQKVKKSMEIQNGHELPIGVLELVKVYIATKRVLSRGIKWQVATEIKVLFQNFTRRRHAIS